MRKRILFVVSLLAIISMIAAACGATPAPTTAPTAAATAKPANTVLIPTAVAPTSASTGPKPGGTFVVADAQSDNPIDPYQTSWHSWPQYAIFPTLFTVDMKLNFQGYLADTWEVGPDNKSLTIHLIKNAKFTDGTPVDAKAIQWDLMHYADKATGSSQGADLVGELLSVDVIDDYTCKLNLDHPLAPLVYYLSNYEIVSPTAYQKQGKADFNTHPVGAGPFMLKEYIAGNSMTLVRNPDYKWAPTKVYKNPGPVYLDQLVIKFIKEDQTVLAALQTGEISFALIPNQNIADVAKDTNITLYKQMATEIRYIGFNTQKAPWDNPAMRQAMGYGVNRDEIVKLAWDGQAEVLYGPLPPTIWGYYPEIKDQARPYDPKKGRAALEALGYKDVNGDGYLEDPQGQPWKAVMTTSTSQETYKRMAEVIVGQYKDMGVRIEINLVEQTTLIDMTTKGTHEMFLLLYGYQDPSILTYFFDPKRIGGSNRARYNNPTLADLLLKADSDMNQTTRFETEKQIQQTVVQEQPWIPLLVPTYTYGIRKEIKGWAINPWGGFNYIDAWYEK